MTRVFIDFLEILFIGTAVFLLAWIFLAEPLEVTGESMEPTLLNNEQIVAEKISPNFSELKRGNIVVFDSPEKTGILVIKRVVGLPGENFTIEKGEIYINDQKLDEPYLSENSSTEPKEKFKDGETIRIPNDSYIVLGDNRKNSSDSRDFGPVKKDLIIGKALFVYYPLENLRVLNNVNALLPTIMVHKFNSAVNF